MKRALARSKSLLDQLRQGLRQNRGKIAMTDTHEAEPELRCPMAIRARDRVSLVDVGTEPWRVFGVFSMRRVGLDAVWSASRKATKVRRLYAARYGAVLRAVRDEPPPIWRVIERSPEGPEERSGRVTWPDDEVRRSAVALQHHRMTSYTALTQTLCTADRQCRRGHSEDREHERAEHRPRPPLSFGQTPESV